MSLIEFLKSDLDQLYEELSQKYLHTSMLSIVYEYKEKISNNAQELITIAFLAAMYDFQMRVGLIKARFSYLIDILKEKKLSILDLNNSIFEEVMQAFLRKYNSFHRFDPKARMLRILLKAFSSIDWSQELEKYDSRIPLDLYVRDIISNKVKEIHGEDRFFNIFIPAKSDAINKRINLFLRWVVRDEYPDLGIWRNLDKSKLLIPLGNEIARVAGRVFFGKDLRLKRKNAIIIA